MMGRPLSQLAEDQTPPGAHYKFHNHTCTLYTTATLGDTTLHYTTHYTVHQPQLCHPSMAGVTGTWSRSARAEWLRCSSHSHRG